MERSSFSILFATRDSKVRKNGKAPIEVTITLNGSRSMFSTGKQVLLSNWDKSRQQVKGRDEVVRMKYHQSNIKKKIIAISNGSRLPKILKMIDGRLPMLTRIPVGKVKDELQKIYDALGMDARAKSTDIDRWLVTRRETLKKDGRSVSYVTLMQRTAIIRDNTKEDED